MTTKKVKEITREQYLALLDLGIPSAAFGEMATAREGHVLMTLLDMADNPHRVKFQRQLAAKDHSFVHIHSLRYFTLVDSDG